MTSLLARFWLLLWRIKAVERAEPMPKKCVIIAAPHTTNWDFPLMLALAKVTGVKVSWLGKRSLFNGPMGSIMRRLGGVAVDREAAGGMVASLAAEFDQHEQLAVVVPAEGTRSKTDYWKSGFYRIAEQAKVPIVLAFVDTSTRSGGFGPAIEVTGDLVADMDTMRGFYEGRTGLKAGRFGPIRLKEESALK
ncbi:MAG TPA: 1-acyl-sn-glycerol-3-phosphate acyltransferase [Ilumatobacteraceae bacterium]|nr:1-acyl-sn-glycerol-3-phosphate acyltransferase [Ilumatobacteraceae bacterium]